MLTKKHTQAFVTTFTNVEKKYSQMFCRKRLRNNSDNICECLLPNVETNVLSMLPKYYVSMLTQNTYKPFVTT